MPARVSYLCLQATQQGQASYAHVHEIIAGLRRRGHDVGLFEPRPGGPSRGLLRRFLAAVVVQLRLWVALPRTDVLYVRFHPVALPSVLMARALRVGVVVEVNGTTADFVSVHPILRPAGRLLARAGRASIRLADAAVAVSDELAEWIRSDAADVPIAVVPNAANPALFRPGRSGPTEDRPYVCFVGALSPWQGIDMLLGGLAHPDWPGEVGLRIAGDGPDRAMVEAAARRDPRVRYEGIVAYDRVGELVAGALVAVSLKTSAAWHSSPLKVFEAMAAGVPVVVTDQPGQTSIVEDAGCGIVVPTGDGAALARAVRRLHDDPELRASLAAASVAAREEHTWDRRAAETSVVIANVVGRTSGQAA